MILLHRAQGTLETNEPGLLVHALRDGTLALPLVFVAVWAGLVLCRRVIERRGSDPAPVVGTALVAVLSATAASLALGLSNPLHAATFGHQHLHAELPWPVHMARDTLAAFSIEFALAAVVAIALVRQRPWTPPERWALPSTRRAPTALK